MRKVILSVIIFIFAAPSAFSAENFFVSCKDHVSDKAFQPLFAKLKSSEFGLEGSSKNIKIDTCMRLSNQEFLFTVSYMNLVGNLYYCGPPAESACVGAPDDATYLPSIRVVKQLSNDKGKKFVLFKTELERSGFYSGGYLIFNLAPKPKAPHGFEIYSLKEASWGYFYGESGEADICTDMRQGDKATSVSEPTINGDGTADLEISFHVTTRICGENKAEIHVTRYRRVGGHFITVTPSSSRQ